MVRGTEPTAAGVPDPDDLRRQVIRGRLLSEPEIVALRPHLDRLGAIASPFGTDAGLYGAAALALFPPV